MRNPTSLLACLAVLSGCDALQPDRSALMATGTASVDRPACTACHGYAPRTGSHRFHMDTTELRVASCYSCHAASIAVSSAPVTDSLFADSAGNFVRTQGWPWLDLDRSKLTFQDITEEIDSMPLLVRWRAPGAEQPEWLTRTARAHGLPGHANGTVDVVFSSEHDYRGQRPVWNAPRLSCNTVKCHDNPLETYEWKDVDE